MPAARCSSATRAESYVAMRQRFGMGVLAAGSRERGAGSQTSCSRLHAPRSTLLFLFRMQRVFAEAGAVLAQLQLFAAHLAPQCVVVVAGLLTDEEHGFDLLLT